MTLGPVGGAARVIVTVKPVGTLTVFFFTFLVTNLVCSSTEVMSAADTSPGVAWPSAGPPVSTPWPLSALASPDGSVICGVAFAASAGMAATAMPPATARARRRMRMDVPPLQRPGWAPVRGSVSSSAAGFLPGSSEERQLSRLGDQPAGAVPHRGVLVEPAVGDERRLSPERQPPRRRPAAQQERQLDGRRPTEAL